MALQSKQLRGFNSSGAIMFLQESPSLQKRDKIQHSGLRSLWETLSVAQAYLFSFTAGDRMIYSLDIHITPRRVWQTFLKRTKTKKQCVSASACFVSKLNLGNFSSDTSRMIQNIPGLWPCTGRFIIQVIILNFFTGQTVMNCDQTHKLHTSRLKSLTSTARKTIKYCAALFFGKINVSFLT